MKNARLAVNDSRGVPIPLRVSNEMERKTNTSTSISWRPHINPPLHVHDAIPLVNRVP